jgi:hypothetical protein
MADFKPTGAAPKLINGVTFYCYRTGILRCEWRSDDGRIRAARNHNRETYWAAVDGATILGRNLSKNKLFRSLDSALIAGTFAAGQKP